MHSDFNTTSLHQWLAWAAIGGGLLLLIAGVPTLLSFVDNAFSVRMETAIVALAEATAVVGLAVSGSLLIAGGLVALSLAPPRSRREE